jgi:hypothetical protein
MAKVLYTAVAEVTGGRAAGHGETSDGQLKVDLRVPKELGGDGGGTNPEEPSSGAARSWRQATRGSPPRSSCFRPAMGASSSRWTWT